MKHNFFYRVLTSIFLLLWMILIIYSKFSLIISLILVSSITFYEFNSMISRIFKKKNLISTFYITLCRFIFLFYLFIFNYIFFMSFSSDYSLNIMSIYILLICISTDIGGMIIGKTFKGKKLTKISPNKTISGSIGSIVFSLILMLVFIFFFNFILNFEMIILTLLVSITSQSGDLFFSYLKRQSKVKDTGKILPGHGGFLDRLDGILLGFPIGIIFQINFI